MTEAVNRSKGIAVKEGTTTGNNLRKRTWATAKLAARVGFAAATRQLNIEIPQSQDDAIAKAVALADQFDGMKGLMLKFGQMASYLNSSMPPEAQQILAKLQAAGTAMPYDTIESQIVTAFGQPVDALFEDFQRNAFAAASIGQVHRARYNGQPVAVKVQYPGIQRIMESDLKNVGMFSQLMFIGTKIDGEGFAEELRDRLMEECDYTLEAQRQTAIGRHWNQQPYSAVPMVVPERSAATVLTTHFEPGTNFYRYIETADETARRNSSLAIFRNVFQGIFRHGFFNGDPHPGNYLFRDDGTVVFLDFGCVRIFPDDLLASWKGMAKSILDRNFAQFKVYVHALGLVGNPKKFDWEWQWDVMKHVYEPFCSATPYRYNKDYVKESYKRLLWENENKRHGCMPPQMLFVNRLQWGLNSVMADLGAEAVYADIFREAVEAPIERVPGLV